MEATIALRPLQQVSIVLALFIISRYIAGAERSIRNVPRWVVQIVSASSYTLVMLTRPVEVFKFGFYMFFPIFVMLRFGDPEWQDTYVKPYKEYLWPSYESTHVRASPRHSTRKSADTGRNRQSRQTNYMRNWRG